jgi:AcrR family transcriptional regulator
MPLSAVTEEARSPSTSTRGRIIAGARRHFFAHGFRSVTMDDLAAELGMSKKTLYAHFPSKQGLIEAAVLDKFHELDGELRHITSAAPADFLDTLHRLLACIQRHTDEIQPPFIRDVRRAAPEVFALVERRRSSLIRRHFTRLFAAGQRAGMIRKDIPARLVIEILLGATQAIMNPDKMAELSLTPRTGFTAIIAVVLEGVVTRTGRAQR